MKATITTKVWCDGSCLGNPGPGGWCAYINTNRWIAGGETGTTNNRTELLAAVVAIEQIPGELLVMCDSKYVIDCATKWRFGWKKRGWKKSDGKEILNRDLIERLDQALTGRSGVRFEWVRGHSGVAGNEAADARARNCATRISKGEKDVIAGPGL
jgi:ribonuclease HI